MLGKCINCGEDREYGDFNIPKLCWKCRKSLRSDLKELGVSTMTANAIVSSGKVANLQQFMASEVDSWIGVRNLGPVGRRQIEAAQALFREEKAMDAKIHWVFLCDFGCGCKLWGNRKTTTSHWKLDSSRCKGHSHDD